MTMLYVGNNHAYRDEVSAARAESARVAANAPRADSLDFNPSLLFRVVWDGDDHYTTDDIEVRHWVAAHPECDVKVMSVAR